MAVGAGWALAFFVIGKPYDDSPIDRPSAQMIGTRVS